MKNNIHKSFTNRRFKDLNVNYIKRIPNINIQNLSIPIDNRLFDIKKEGSFDEFIRIKSPYFKRKGRAITINVPLKYHRQSNKFLNNNWIRKNTIQLKKIKNNFYLNIFWERPNVIKNEVTTVIGIDVGYKKLISSSNGVHYGQEL